MTPQIVEVLKTAVCSLPVVLVSRGLATHSAAGSAGELLILETEKQDPHLPVGPKASAGKPCFSPPLTSCWPDQQD